MKNTVALGFYEHIGFVKSGVVSGGAAVAYPVKDSWLLLLRPEPLPPWLDPNNRQHSQ